MLGAMGVTHPDHLRPWNLMVRTGPNEIKNFAQIFDFVDDGDFLKGKLPADYLWPYEMASAESFENLKKVSPVPFS
jgi:hypothetical protein